MNLNPRVFSFSNDLKVRAYHSQGVLNLDFGICFFFKKKRKKRLSYLLAFFPLKQKKKQETSNLVKLFFSQLPRENGGKGAGEVKPEREKVNMMNGKSSE